MTLLPVKDLEVALSKVSTTVASDDLLVLLSARDHNLSWSYALEQMPKQLATRFPDQPLLVVYAAENSGASGD